MESAKFFNQSDIDEFRDCFNLFARSKAITNAQELTIIMRSLGFSPTSPELNKYFQEHQKDGIIDFANFLDIMHKHSQREKCQEEIAAAFAAHDPRETGTVPGPELHHILTKFGEKLSQEEVERLFKEANANPRGLVKYEDVLGVVVTPIPDY